MLRALRNEPFKNAVNLPQVAPDVLKKLQPYFGLGERIGRFLGQVIQGAVHEIQIDYSGDLVEWDMNPLTRYIVKGALTPHLGDEVNIVNALYLAKTRDIAVSVRKSSASRGFTNLVRVSLRSNREERTAAGTLLSGYGERIVEIDGYPVDVAPEGHLLLVSHFDKPGIIGRLGTTLGANDVNIATMQVGRKTVGGPAIMVLAVDKPVPKDVLAEIARQPEIRSVREIDL